MWFSLCGFTNLMLCSASLRMLRVLSRYTESGLESALMTVEMLLAAHLNRVFVVSTTYAT